MLTLTLPDFESFVAEFGRALDEVDEQAQRRLNQQADLDLDEVLCRQWAQRHAPAVRATVCESFATVGSRLEAIEGRLASVESSKLRGHVLATISRTVAERAAKIDELYQMLADVAAAWDDVESVRTHLRSLADMFAELADRIEQQAQTLADTSADTLASAGLRSVDAAVHQWREQESLCRHHLDAH